MVPALLPPDGRDAPLCPLLGNGPHCLTLVNSLRRLEEHFRLFIYKAAAVLRVPIGPHVARVVKPLTSATIDQHLVALRCSPRFPLCLLYQLVQTKLGVVLGIVVGRIKFIPQCKQPAAHFL